MSLKWKMQTRNQYFYSMFWFLILNKMFINLEIFLLASCVTAEENLANYLTPPHISILAVMALFLVSLLLILII